MSKVLDSGRRRFIAGCTLLPILSRGWLRKIAGADEAKADSRDFEPDLIHFVRSIKGRNNDSLRVFYPKGCLGNLQEFVADFESKTGIKVELQEAALDEISAQLTLEHRMSSETRFDVALPPTFAIPDLASARIIAPLNEFAKLYEPPHFFDSSLYRLGDRFLDQLYGYQADGDAYMMFYNKSWLESERNQAEFANLHNKALRIPQTWAELDLQLKFFHKPAEGRYGGSLFRNSNYVIWELWARLHAKGIFPFDEAMQPRIASDEGIAALEELVASTQYLEPEVSSNGLFENFKSFAKGNKYCNIGWGGTQKYLRSKESTMRDNLKFSSLPGGESKDLSFPVPYFNWGWNYVVMERSQKKELAYLFCLFAASSKSSTKAVRNEGGYFDPHRIEHYQDPAIISIYGADFLEVHQQCLSRSIPDLYLAGHSLYMSALKNAAKLAIEHKVPAKLVMQKTAARWQEITEHVGKEMQIKQWLKLKSQYPENLRQVLR